MNISLRFPFFRGRIGSPGIIRVKLEKWKRYPIIYLRIEFMGHGCIILNTA